MNAREAWLEERRTGIGGSDTAPILGLSPYKTPLAIYQEKRGEARSIEDNAPMKWGRQLEPVIRQEYSDQTGRVVLVPERMRRHPQHDFMVANVDGFTEDGRIFEAKTARTANGWGEPGSDQVPQGYLLQVQHYMAVLGMAVADVAVLIGGSDFRLYEVPADRELQQMLIDAEADFWACVQRGEPPEPVTFADAMARWGHASKAGSVLADDEAQAAVLDLGRLREQIAALEARQEQAKAVVMRALGERDTLVSPQGDVLCTWKAGKPSQRLDAVALKAAHPNIYSLFLKASEPSRRFLLKA